MIASRAFRRDRHLVSRWRLIVAAYNLICLWRPRCWRVPVIRLSQAVRHRRRLHRLLVRIVTRGRCRPSPEAGSRRGTCAISVCIFHESKRGAEQAHVYWAQVKASRKPASLDTANLPPTLIESQADFI